MNRQTLTVTIFAAAALAGLAAARPAQADRGLADRVQRRLDGVAERGRSALEQAGRDEQAGQDSGGAQANWFWSRTVTVEVNGDLDQRDAVFHKPRCTSARAYVDGREYVGEVKNGHLPVWVCPAKFKKVPVRSTVRIVIEGEYNGQAVRGEDSFEVGDPPKLGNTVHVGTVLLKTTTSAPPPHPQPDPATTCPKKAIGDANCDGAVNSMDHALWLMEYSGQRSARDADFNGDGRVDKADGDIVRGHLGQ